MKKPKRPSRVVLSEIKSRGYTGTCWSLIQDEPDWEDFPRFMSYCHKVIDKKKHYFLITASYVTGRWVVEVSKQHEQFNVDEKRNGKKPH